MQQPYEVVVVGADGVDMRHVQTDPAGTSRSVNLMNPDGSRHGCFDGKSHLLLQPDLEGLPLPVAVRRGQLAARWCCTLRGTSRCLTTATQLHELSRSYDG